MSGSMIIYTNNMRYFIIHICIEYVLTYLHHLDHTAGTPRFCLLSPVVAYSACLFAFLTVSVYCNIIYLMAFIHDSRNFDHKIHITLYICASSLSIFVPICMALDVKKLVHYTSEWVQFQVGCKN